MAATQDMIDALVARLRQALPDLAVEHFPAPPDAYALTHAVGALLAGYAGSEYGPRVDAAASVQSRRAKFAVTVVSRQLAGRGGALDALDRARRALVGFALPDGETLAAAADTFVGRTDSEWRYAIEFAADAVIVEEAEPVDGPLLTEVTYEEKP
ncbi:Gp37 family protein [Burkholderia thailandensis]|uniref:Cytoplasmic protein n=2 Tax=Burkholderia thailandensis TaxID=57975 RepID=A0AAW9CS86_BURTH|nr:Gp37 family protein [Burkholderia thailandensis]AHI66994.1 gp37 family protein [Burkholderia thailandensis H0587]AIP66871.1 hypothetical protein DR62_5559 [Burkholderia thailandensis]AJY31330.1 gp37 family protein [Burkholderia thailandensis 34]AOI54275.1 hypothetical protein WI24_20620 [Burkholderia thailandensis]AOJ53257.1 hypothetical protein AQ475_20445 [Burkholderia thailandensis]